MNQHTAQDVKGNHQYHVTQRTMRAMNSFLEDARLAMSGEFGDCPDLEAHYIDCYIRFLQRFHKDGEAGSLLQEELSS